MGWTVERATRDDVVKRQVGPFTTVSGNTVAAEQHHRSGSEDWFLYAVYNEQNELVEKRIQVTIWDGRAHKDMGEEVHPFYVGCPVEWFDDVPVRCEKWREHVQQAAAVAT